MSRLIRTPGGYWTAFFKGFLGTIGVCIAPMVGLVFEARPKLAELPQVAGRLLLIVTAGAVIVGVAFVVPRLLYAWAYRRFTQI